MSLLRRLSPLTRSAFSSKISLIDCYCRSKSKVVSCLVFGTSNLATSRGKSTFNLSQNICHQVQVKGQGQNYQFSSLVEKGTIKMAGGSSELPETVKAKLDKIPDVIIDESGKFKYILIKVFAKDKDGKDNDRNSKVIVRGRADCIYHGDIFDKYQEETSRLEGVDDDILGGGRIERTGNKIFVYGYSQGYGKADHTLTVEILKKKYPTHDITWSDAGY